MLEEGVSAIQRRFFWCTHPDNIDDGVVSVWQNVVFFDICTTSDAAKKTAPKVESPVQRTTNYQP